MAAVRAIADPNPTAVQLQSRISHLSYQLLRRYNALLANASESEDDTGSPTADGERSTKDPSAIETVAKQIDIQVETQAIIKAAEDIMALTRSMKELWLFGGLNTVDSEEQKIQKREQKESRDKEVLEIRQGVDQWLEGWVNTHRERSGETETEHQRFEDTINAADKDSDEDAG